MEFSELVVVSGQKTLSPSMIIAYITRSSFEVFHVDLHFPRGTKRGNLQMHAKCVLKCNITYMRSFNRISYLNVFFWYFEMFSFESYFAWICAFCMDFA